MDAPRSGSSRCFVSHDYEDKAALKTCLGRRFPGGLEPFVFPPLTVTPEQAVSQHLIDALRDCESLVYLNTPISLGSFWVGFERNMAARLEKRVYAFHPRRLLRAFTRDTRPAVDPMVSILFNLCIREDVETLSQIRELVWDRYRFEIRGDQWRRLDNEARQMFDSIDGMERKLAAGGVALVFLSNASVSSSHHDYVDPFTYRRAIKDAETPIGYTAEKFARLDPDRTLVIWLDPPDRERLEAALDPMPANWGSYVRIVRASLHDPHKLVVRQSAGGFDLNHLDTMLARCFWAAREADPRMAAEFRQALTGKD